MPDDDMPEVDFEPECFIIFDDFFLWDIVLPPLMDDEPELIEPELIDEPEPMEPEVMEPPLAPPPVMEPAVD